MRTFKQWLVHQYGTAILKVTPKIITKFTNTVPADTRSCNISKRLFRESKSGEVCALMRFADDG